MSRTMKALRAIPRVLLAPLFVLCAGSALRGDPLEATITSPSGAITVATNQSVSFTATSNDSTAPTSSGYTVTSFTWTFGDGASLSGASASHAFASPGTYTVTLQVAWTKTACVGGYDADGNCKRYGPRAGTSTATRTVTVVLPPSISSFAASKPAVETGTPVTLSWATANASSLSISGIGTVTGTSITVTPSATTTYVLTASGVGPSATASVQVSAYTITVGISPGSARIPFGGSQAFTGSASSPVNQGVSWTASGGTLSGTTSAAATFLGTASGDFTLTARSLEDPARSASVPVTVETVSVSTPSPANASVYAGSALTFSATVSGAVNTGVSWSASGGATITSGGQFTANTPGTYTVTATSQADGSKAASTSVTVNSLGISLSGATTVPYGGSATLTPSFPVGSGVLTPGNVAVTSGTGVAVGPLTSSTSYTLTVTNGGYSTTASATVSVAAVTVSTPSPANASVYAGSPLTFSATVSGAVNTGVSWSASGGATITSGGQFTATAPGTYTVTATSQADGSTHASTSVTVNGFSPSLSGATTVPYGGSATLTPSFPLGSGVLNPGNRAVTSGTGVAVGPLTSSTSYTLTVTNGGYSTSASATVSVAAVTVSTPSPANASVYAGSPLTFSATVSGAVNTGVSWSASGGATITPGGQFTATAPGTYTVTATSQADGSTHASTTVTVNGLGISLSGATTVPYGGSATLTPSFPLGSGVLTPGNVAVTSGTGVAVGPLTSATSYTLTVTNGGYSTSTSATVSVTPVAVSVPSPANASVYAGFSQTFTASVSGAVNTGVSWSVSGGGTINASGQFTAGSTPGTWTVTATSLANGATNSTQVTVLKAVVSSVVVSPGAAALRPGESKTFTAAVSGSGITDFGVTWQVVTANGGSITSAGVYTAPSTPGTYTVQAKSNQDGTTVGSATVTVKGWVLKWKKDVVYSGAREIAEVDAAGVHAVLADHLGTPRTLVGAGGVIESTQKSLPFGESLTDPTSAAKFEKGYTNHEQTDPSGLIYMQARFYAPQYGRFLSPDPARDQHFEETQSWNIYSYVQNIPTMRIDPTGMVAGEPDEQQKPTPSKDDLASATAATGDPGKRPAQTKKDTYQSKSGDVVTSILNGDFKGAAKNLLQAWGLAVKDPEWVATAALATTAPFLAAEGGAAKSVSTEASSSLSGARLSMQLTAEEAAGVRAPTSITSYSSHALDQIAGRDGGLGVKPTAVANAFQNPSAIQYKPSKYGPTFAYTGNNATVIVNPQGRVVTTWATNSSGTLGQ